MVRDLHFYLAIGQAILVVVIWDSSSDIRLYIYQAIGNRPGIRSCLT